jgi:hypothetical protein
MDLPKCKICGERHRLGGCPTSSGGGAARGKSDPAPPEAKRGLRVPALKSHAPIGDGIALTSIAHPAPTKRKRAPKGTFDRTAYQREYMRKRRKKEQEK